ncbi:MAG: hypothetical protein LBU13_05095 [Synergistaceae bacterium]|jgi:hypothetical protein|nr:hypothetical protein [Synergistaceae bacterium]
MEVEPIASPGFWAALMKAECVLTLNIAVGLAAGELILALGIVDRLFSPLIPRLERLGIHGKIAAAMVLALGAPRAGAALISRAYSEGELTDDQATFGTLSLAFPGYLKRWVGTAAMAAAMAGVSGFIFALVMVLRSACRFVWMAAMLARRARAHSGVFMGLEKKYAGARERVGRVWAQLRRSLPWAWAFFALTYVLVPFVDSAFSKYASRGGMLWFLPAEGWAVAASSLAHVTAGLSSAAAALSVGKLGVAQTVLALLVGNMAGSVTRTMRQNVGYWVGVFPKRLVKNLLRWHLVTTTMLEVFSISIVWCITVVK